MSTPPPEGRGHYSVARVLDAWYIVCRGGELGDAPVQRDIFGSPVVAFRAEGGQAVVLLDRCAHRNVPLSRGRVVDCQLECPYHGWRYNAVGVCRHVPALPGEQEGRARRVPCYPVREQQGYVWAFMRPDTTPSSEPFALPHLDDPAYTCLRYDAAFAATLHATAENILDVPHTAFLHRGLFRGGTRHRIEAVVRRSASAVEAEYVGEPRPGGWLGRLLAPGGGTVQHVDRFILPSVAQVEYRLGQSHLVITNVLTPTDDFHTLMHTALALRLPRATRAIARVLMPLAMKVVRQDAEILALQSDTIRRFGGEQYVSTPVDLLGPHVWRLLRQAERGEGPPVEAVTEERTEILA